MPGIKTKEVKITAFKWRGEIHQVKDGKDVIKMLLNQLAKVSPARIDLLAVFLNNRKAWLKQDSQDKTDFNRPYHITGTKWFIDTNMSTKNIMQKSKQIALEFGVGANTIEFYSRTRIL